ncbi:hypothetical protein JMUB7551_28720 [Staphylococcus aureus]
MTKRQMGIFIYAGIIGGLLSGIVKLGWEVMFPPVSYTHLRAHETLSDLVCRLLLEKIL